MVFDCVFLLHKTKFEIKCNESKSLSTALFKRFSVTTKSNKPSQFLLSKVKLYAIDWDIFSKYFFMKNITAIFV